MRGHIVGHEPVVSLSRIGEPSPQIDALVLPNMKPIEQDSCLPSLAHGIISVLPEFARMNVCEHRFSALNIRAALGLREGDCVRVKN